MTPEDTAVAATVREALKAVIDPELGQNLVDLGLIYAIEVIDLCIVSVTMTTTTRGCPATAYLKQAVHDCTKAVPGIQFVEVILTHEPAWTPDQIAPALAATFRR
jgi:metal-sulfur cluster biosynthetic enzyme